MSSSKCLKYEIPFALAAIKKIIKNSSIALLLNFAGQFIDFIILGELTFISDIFSPLYFLILLNLNLIPIRFKISIAPNLVIFTFTFFIFIWDFFVRIVKAITKPYPGAWGLIQGQKVRIYSAKISELAFQGTPGKTILTKGIKPVVICKKESIEILNYEFEKQPNRRLSNKEITNNENVGCLDKLVGNCFAIFSSKDIRNKLDDGVYEKLKNLNFKFIYDYTGFAIGSELSEYLEIGEIIIRPDKKIYGLSSTTININQLALELLMQIE